MNRVTFSVVAIMLLAAATTLPFVLNAGFPASAAGCAAQSCRTVAELRDGQFHNQLPTPGIHRPEKHAGRVGIFWSRNEKTRARSKKPLPLVNTDLAGLPSGEDVIVW